MSYFEFTAAKIDIIFEYSKSFAVFSLLFHHPSSIIHQYARCKSLGICRRR